MCIVTSEMVHSHLRVSGTLVCFYTVREKLTFWPGLRILSSEKSQN